jgi:hypothetical protein
MTSPLGKRIRTPAIPGTLDTARPRPESPWPSPPLQL